MNTGSLMKWVLIAGAAYLVYRYLDQQGYFGTELPAPAQPVGATAVATAVSSNNLLLASPGAVTTAPGAINTVAPVTAEAPAQNQPSTTVYAGVSAPDGTAPVSAPSAGEVIVMPASWGATITPGTSPGNTYTLEPLPSECQNVRSAQQGAQCSAVMTARGRSLSGYDAQDEALPSMDELLAALAPYRNRWGNA